MSLQVWLPLNGDLENKGLANINVTNNGATIDNNGKIGKCYSFDGVDDGINFSGWDASGLNELSVSLWVYPLTSTLKNILSMEVGAYWQFSFFNNSIAIRDNGNGYTGTRTDISLGNFTANKWVNLIITYNKGVVKIYKDGILFKEGTTPGTALNTGINHYVIGQAYQGDTYFANDKLNDIRIYDHCLSEKEVKEISKGLALHYKLDDGYIENTTNLSARNGTGGWNNSGTSSRNNNDTSFELIPIRECPVYSITQTTAGQSAITFGATTISGIHTITASMWFYMNSVNTSSDIGPYIRSSKTDSSLASFKYNNSTNFRTWPQKEWIYITATCTTSSEETGVYLCAYTSGLNQKFAFNGWQIEEKDHATPYTPSNRTGNIVYDNSGYGYNGTINGSLVINNDSAKYSKCTVFDGSTASITLGNLSTICPEGNFTFNCWIYKDGTWSTKNWETIFGGPGGFELETKYSSTNSPVLFNYNWGKTSMPYNLNEWTMITMTRNSSETKYYINGSLAGTGTAGTIPSGNYFIGAWSSSSGQNYKGKVSDVRIYNTILSESDIKELYETSASIDKNGNLYCRELVEV